MNKTQIELLLLAIVFGCIAHFTGHKCAGLAAVSALVFMKLQ